MGISATISRAPDMNRGKDALYQCKTPHSPLFASAFELEVISALTSENEIRQFSDSEKAQLIQFRENLKRSQELNLAMAGLKYITDERDVDEALTNLSANIL